MQKESNSASNSRLTRPKGLTIPHMISAGLAPVGITTDGLPHCSICLQLLSAGLVPVGSHDWQP